LLKETRNLLKKSLWCLVLVVVDQQAIGTIVFGLLALRMAFYIVTRVTNNRP